MKRLLELFSEANGQLSSTRAQTWIVILTFAGDWIMHIVRSAPFQPDLSLVGVVIGVLGLKVAQKPFEEKPNEKGGPDGSQG